MHKKLLNYPEIPKKLYSKQENLRLGLLWREEEEG